MIFSIDRQPDVLSRIGTANNSSLCCVCPSFPPDQVIRWVCTAAKVAAFLVVAGALVTAGYYSGVLGAHLLGCGEQVWGGIVLFGTGCIGLSVLATPVVGALLLGNWEHYPPDNRGTDTLKKMGLFVAAEVALPGMIALLVVASVALIAIGCCCLVLMAQGGR